MEFLTGTGVGMVKMNASTVSNSSRVLTASSIIPAWAVVMVSGPPRSAVRSRRHSASARPMGLLGSSAWSSGRGPNCAMARFISESP